MRLRPSPSLVVAGAALFVALGGSALAVSEAVRPQARCAPGAVRGIAAVTGLPSAGMANIPDKFASNRALFSRTFNCAGGATQVRRVNVGVYEVRFAGNSAPTALASAGVGHAAAISPVAGGAFQVSVYVIGRNDPADVGFVVVAV